MNSDLRDWLRKRTSAWISEPTRHCLSERYQVFEGTWPVAGIPAFLEDLRPIQDIAPTAPWRDASFESQGDLEQRIERYETLLQRKMEVIRETRNEFAGLLGNQGESQDEAGDGPKLEDLREEHQAYDLLSNREEALKRRVEQLADFIDEEFGTTQPSTGESTDILSEARDLWLWSRSLDQEVDSGAELREFVSAETVSHEWFIDGSVSPTAHEAALRRNHPAHPVLSSLSEPTERACLRVSEIDRGFSCGFESLPADATVGQTHCFVAHYFEDLRNEADWKGNTHALLAFRLQMLQMVLREYDLFGQVDTWSREDVKEGTEEWREVNFDKERGRLRDPQRLLSKTEEYLCQPEKKDKSWRKEGEKMVPNMSGLYSLIKENEIRALYKERRDDPITVQAYRRNVNRYFRDSDIEKFRKEAGLTD